MKKYYDRGCKTTPFSYPTHSVSGVVEVMRSLPLTVSAIGYRNRNNDPYFANSDFSNITALFRTASLPSSTGPAFRRSASSSRIRASACSMSAGSS